MQFHIQMKRKGKKERKDKKKDRGGAREWKTERKGNHSIPCSNRLTASERDGDRETTKAKDEEESDRVKEIQEERQKE